MCISIMRRVEELLFEFITVSNAILAAERKELVVVRSSVARRSENHFSAKWLANINGTFQSACA
jgi:hypothetical protein